MTRCNRFGIHYSFNDIPSTLFYLSLFHALYSMIILDLHLLHCTWLECIRSCMEDPSHGFLKSRFVHSRFMDLGNRFEGVVHHLLIGGMVGLGHRDRVPMVSALVYVVTHWIGPMISHDIRLLGIHDFIKLLYCIVSQPWENIEFVKKLAVALTYRWDRKLIIYSLWIRSLLMEVGSNRYSQ